jgi:hypothetical protein
VPNLKVKRQEERLSSFALRDSAWVAFYKVYILNEMLSTSPLSPRVPLVSKSPPCLQESPLSPRVPLVPLVSKSPPCPFWKVNQIGLR